MFFKKKPKQKTYDHTTLTPVIRCSICTGEQVAGFKNIHTGAFQEVLLIRGIDDLRFFKEQYGIEGDIEKVY